MNVGSFCRPFVLPLTTARAGRVGDCVVGAGRVLTRDTGQVRVVVFLAYA